MVIVAHTNRSKSSGRGVRSWGGGCAFGVADTSTRGEEPSSGEQAGRGKGNLEVDGGKRIRWNDRNHCCQGFLKIRLQRVDGVGGGRYRDFLRQEGIREGKDKGEERNRERGKI